MRHDTMVFEKNLESNIFDLHKSLENKTYRHSGYLEFFVNDPKRRHIHKATVRDRIVHQVLYNYLVDVFEKTFIFDSYSCRLGKGTHKAVKRLRYFVRIVSRNNSNPCWVMKLDVKKFFATIDHEILFELLEEKMVDENILWLCREIIESYTSDVKDRNVVLGTGRSAGIPLGNLTSQIFANIYLNVLDQFVKHRLKIKYYLRYADDFVIVSKNALDTIQLISQLGDFLRIRLKLNLHSDKIIQRKLGWGIDYLGYIVLPYCIIPRTSTKRRMLLNLESKTKEFYRGNVEWVSFNQTLQSYLGYLNHSNSFKTRIILETQFFRK